PSLIFANNKRDIHPLRGLCEHGPFSKSLNYLQDIQVAIISPFKSNFKLINLIGELNKSASPKIAPDYYPEYPGFENLFETKLLTPKSDLTIELPQEANQFAQSGDYKTITKYLLHAISKLVAHKSSISVVFIYLPSSWEKCFTDENFDLHDQLKAKAAPLGIPIQIINDNSIQTKCRANVMWGLSVAIYSKAGGVPWKVEALNEDHAYIGLSYAMKTSKEDGTQYTTCCSQVYDPEGTGFEFIAFDTHEFTQDRQRNPYLTYNEMHAVMSQSLKIYQDNHGGNIPNKITVHKTTPFTDQEIEGCYDAFGQNTEVELLQIVRHPKIKGVRFDNKKAANYPCKRGSYFPISKNECLLWIQGTLEGITKSGKELFKEGGLKPMPKPVLLRRFSGDGGWHETCSSIVGLSKMDWNNNTIYKSMPVTIVYSKLFASVVKNVPDINKRIYDYRFFM
ncbi:MAG TPA: nuclease PIN, partial [Balneolaceae bacterium]|nr:nuclease PIN [Balneolaceae bacterium]